MRDNTALIERVREGDKQAENRMVEENMGLVYSIARRFLNRGYDAEDLTQIGAIGLIKAVKKFNPEFNVQFSTYAVPMITGEIKRFLRDDGAVKISRTLKENAMKGWRCEELLRRKCHLTSDGEWDGNIRHQDLMSSFPQFCRNSCGKIPGSSYQDLHLLFFLLW